MAGSETCDGVMHYQVIGFFRKRDGFRILYQTEIKEERDAYFNYLKWKLNPGDDLMYYERYIAEY